MRYEDVPDPKIEGPTDVIVRIGGAGVCRTDLHVVEGIWRTKVEVKLPYIMGHENAGWVEAMGSAVTGVKVVDAVICHPLVVISEKGIIDNQVGTSGGGMFLWVRLQEGMNAVTLKPKAVQKNVAFVPGAAFYPDNAAHVACGCRL